jgi:hypothetical protein
MTTTGNLLVRNTSITNCGTGVFASTSAGGALVSIDHSAIHNNTNGIEASTNGRVMVSNSQISENSSNGLLASTSTSQINAEGNQIAFCNVAGVNCSVAGGSIRISDNEIYNNTTGVNIAGSCVVNSTGNNRIFANSTNVSGALSGAINQQ